MYLCNVYEELFIYLCIYVYLELYIYLCIYVYQELYIYLCIYVDLELYIYLCIYVDLELCVVFHLLSWDLECGEYNLIITIRPEYTIHTYIHSLTHTSTFYPVYSSNFSNVCSNKLNCGGVAREISKINHHSAEFDLLRENDYILSIIIIINIMIIKNNNITPGKFLKFKRNASNDNYNNNNKIVR